MYVTARELKDRSLTSNHGGLNLTYASLGELGPSDHLDLTAFLR
jgi:hypothetical protein